MNRTRDLKVGKSCQTVCSHKSESAYSESLYSIGVGQKGSRKRGTKSGTVSSYATIQPPKLPPPKPSASMGVEGSGSGPRALDVMVKSGVKKSIMVYVVWGLSMMA
jgi:hypothetical protein